MTRAVLGLLLGALLCASAEFAGQSPGDGVQRSAKPVGVTLTNERPTGYFAVDPETLVAAPPVLALKVTRVVNPSRMPFQVFVYLSYDSGREEKGRTGQILIGNFGLYPADRPAGARLRASNAFRQLKAASSKPIDVRLRLEMKRIHEESPWASLEVTVAPPEWQDEVGK
jgi:hypothetical protein